ncbi:GNAT family N-acetyltransferase [Alteribacter aurantiacus]|uniref:GNAT family N-acetyltransferase n=1 Tax=Alteribacter aurantiacus TaxID=254410 RepID=UPI000416E39E|nr:GNAT family protein [Alteribacter aurantiacus]
MTGERFTFVKLRRSHAEEIVFWTYQKPYDLYNLDRTTECIKDLVTEPYYACLNGKGELIGFCCVGEEARVPGGYNEDIYKDKRYLDVGIGLKPELTGLGLGKPFFSQVLTFLGDTYSTPRFRLVVATFNKRAIRLYRSLGFTDERVFYSQLKGKPMAFLCMVKEPY